MPEATKHVAAAADTAPTRDELLARWNAARRRRETAALESAEYERATIEVGEIEVMINAVDVEASEGRSVKPAHRVKVQHS